MLILELKMKNEFYMGLRNLIQDHYYYMISIEVVRLECVYRDRFFTGLLCFFYYTDL